MQGELVDKKIVQTKQILSVQVKKSRNLSILSQSVSVQDRPPAAQDLVPQLMMESRSLEYSIKRKKSQKNPPKNNRTTRERNNQQQLGTKERQVPNLLREYRLFIYNICSCLLLQCQHEKVNLQSSENMKKCTKPSIFLILHTGQRLKRNSFELA